jgi:hypothetical protein
MNPPATVAIFPHDFTTNLGYVWHSSWKGQMALGIRQLPDDATAYAFDNDGPL